MFVPAIYTMQNDGSDTLVLVNGKTIARFYSNSYTDGSLYARNFLRKQEEYDNITDKLFSNDGV